MQFKGPQVFSYDCNIHRTSLTIYLYNDKPAHMHTDESRYTVVDKPWHTMPEWYLISDTRLSCIFKFQNEVGKVSCNVILNGEGNFLKYPALKAVRECLAVFQTSRWQGSPCIWWQHTWYSKQWNVFHRKPGTYMYNLWRFPTPLSDHETDMMSLRRVRHATGHIQCTNPSPLTGQSDIDHFDSRLLQW